MYLMFCWFIIKYEGKNNNSCRIIIFYRVTTVGVNSGFHIHIPNSYQLRHLTVTLAYVFFWSFIHQICITDLLHKSHNPPVPYTAMHHFVTEKCTCVHISVTKWCTCIMRWLPNVGFVTWVCNVHLHTFILGLSKPHQVDFECKWYGDQWLALTHWPLGDFNLILGR